MSKGQVGAFVPPRRSIAPTANRPKLCPHLVPPGERTHTSEHFSQRTTLVRSLARSYDTQQLAGHKLASSKTQTKLSSQPLLSSSLTTLCKMSGNLWRAQIVSSSNNELPPRPCSLSRSTWRALLARNSRLLSLSQSLPTCSCSPSSCLNSAPLVCLWHHNNHATIGTKRQLILRSQTPKLSDEQSDTQHDDVDTLRLGSVFFFARKF